MKQVKMKVDPELIKVLRDVKCWTQNQLANESSLSLRTIQRIESVGSSSSDTYRSIGLAFGLNLSDLDGSRCKSLIYDQDMNQFLRSVDQTIRMSDLIRPEHTYRINFDNPDSQQEVEVISGIVQFIDDIGIGSSKLDVGCWISTAYTFLRKIRGVESANYCVYWNKFPLVIDDKEVLDTGINMYFVKNNNPNIIYI